jgi:serine phosphatase RsbU (regulator of sigma subunit)
MGDNYVTAFACHIDLIGGRIISACAGHPPALILDPDGNVRVVHATGMFIAGIDNLNCIDDESYLHRGDRLILYTDGVTEARSETSEFGDDGLIDIIKKNSTMAPKNLCDMIHRHVQSFTGSEFLEDDFTILVFDYLEID